jgi:hypothetical protein
MNDDLLAQLKACREELALAEELIEKLLSRGRYKFTAEEREEAVLRVKRGEKAATVAADLRVRSDTVRHWCYQAGVIPRYLRNRP